MFGLFHPAVALAYFGTFLVFAMTALQPVYVALSYLAALACHVLARGARATVRAACWHVPLVLLIALVNMVASPNGSTELLRVGSHAFYLESLAFGACMGLMLATVLLAFANASCALSSDKVLALFGGVLPVVGLMMSMTARLVPRIVRSGRTIGAVQRACTSATPCGGRLERGESTGGQSACRQGAAAHPAGFAGEVGAVSTSPAAGAAARPDGAPARPGGASTHAAGGLLRRLAPAVRLRLASVLMGWSMEGSLETAQAMKARGWGACRRRTTYARYRFRRRDAEAMAVLALLVAASAASAFAACSQFSFYPRMGVVAPWYSYAPYLVFSVAPLVVEAAQRRRWRA